MFLRGTIRKKNGKEHRYWSIVENKRVAGGKVRQRHVLYLGEINASQERAWRKSIEVLDVNRRRKLTPNRRPILTPPTMGMPPLSLELWSGAEQRRAQRRSAVRGRSSGLAAEYPFLAALP